MRDCSRQQHQEKVGTSVDGNFLKEINGHLNILLIVQKHHPGFSLGLKYADTEHGAKDNPLLGNLNLHRTIQVIAQCFKKMAEQLLYALRAFLDGVQLLVYFFDE